MKISKKHIFNGGIPVKVKLQQEKVPSHIRYLQAIGIAAVRWQDHSSMAASLMVKPEYTSIKKSIS